MKLYLESYWKGQLGVGIDTETQNTSGHNFERFTPVHVYACVLLFNVSFH